MGLNLGNLPEKNYFTVDELASRWSCDLNLIYHYIFEQKSLRVAALFKPCREHSLLPIRHFEGHHNDIIEYIWDAICHYDPPPLRIRYKPYCENFGKFDFSSISEEEFSELPLFQEVDEETQPVFLYLDVESIGCSDPGLIESGYVPEEYKRYGTKFLNEDNRKCYLIITNEFDGEVFYAFDFIPLNEFIYITKIERDRFEREYGITEETENVQRQVSNKTENIYLGLIQLFAGTLLSQGLTEKPHSDAATIERLLSKKGKVLPCTKEVLARYLKKNRI